MPRAERVFIVWMGKGEDAKFSYLTYSDGTIRVYYKNRYDDRLNLGQEELLPYFDEFLECAKWMAQNRGKQCQANVGVAGAFGVIDSLSETVPM